MISSELLAELPYLLLGTVILAAGLATAAFAVFQLSDLALFDRGLFASLYRSACSLSTQGSPVFLRSQK